MPGMLQPTLPPLSRRAITGVLLLWLCVVAAGVWAPMARAQLAAQGAERLCSGALAPQWTASPLAHAAQGDAAALHHLIDCPLCLPVLAPPPALHSRVLPVLAPQLPWPVMAAVPLQALAHWPPARGPPVSTPVL